MDRRCFLSGLLSSLEQLRENVALIVTLRKMLAVAYRNPMRKRGIDGETETVLAHGLLWQRYDQGPRALRQRATLEARMAGVETRSP